MLHSESDAEEIKDEDVTSGRNRSPAFCKDAANDDKPDIPIEEYEFRDAEGDRKRIYFTVTRANQECRISSKDTHPSHLTRFTVFL